jgi:integrase
MKLTKKNVAALEKPAKPTIYYDTELTGFGLRVMPSGVKAWVIEYRPGAGGRGVTKKRMKVGGSELDADKARDGAKRLLASVSLGSNPGGARADERASASIAEIAELFMKRHVTRKRKASSAAAYQKIFDVHIIPAIGAERASMVTRAAVAEMHDDISEPVNGRGGRSIANKAVAVLSSMFTWAAKNGLVPDSFNPAMGVDRFAEQQRDRFLTTEEIGRIGAVLIEAETVGIPYEVDESAPKSKHARKPENRRVVFSPHVTAAIRLLMLTGCRLREILHLEWSHVDFQRGLLFLPDSKTGRKTVVLSAAAVIVLQSLTRVGKYVIAGNSAGEQHEKPRSDLKKPWASILKRAGLTSVRLHDLRHTFASVGVGSGMGLPIIGKLLGHSQAATTARYARLDADPVRRAADEIAEQISTALAGR